MHKVFGIKENAEYKDREGAYLILVKDNQVGIIQTPKGFFFLGGGVEGNESHIECIGRECIEEAGCVVSIKGKMFVEMQNWALEQCFKCTDSI